MFYIAFVQANAGPEDMNCLIQCPGVAATS